MRSGMGRYRTCASTVPTSHPSGMRNSCWVRRLLPGAMRLSLAVSMAMFFLCLDSVLPPQMHSPNKELRRILPDSDGSEIEEVEDGEDDAWPCARVASTRRLLALRRETTRANTPSEMDRERERSRDVVAPYGTEWQRWRMELHAFQQRKRPDMGRNRGMLSGMHHHT